MMKPIDHSIATHTVALDGLGICCFNKGASKWQIGFLRRDPHVLSLEIAGTKQLIDYGTRNIRIYTVNGMQPDYQNEYPDGCYMVGDHVDRLDGSMPDPENFRWTMDLNSELDMGEKGLQLTRPPYPVTLAEINKGLAFVSRVFPDDLYRLPAGDDPNSMAATTLSGFRFGRTSDEISVDIVCDPRGQVVIDIDGYLQYLPTVPGQPWEVRLTNMDPPVPGAPHIPWAKGDFDMYYDAISNANRKYALWGGHSLLLGWRTDCNLAWTSKGNNLDPLFT